MRSFISVAIFPVSRVRGCGLLSAVPGKKKKTKRFRATTAVKAMARKAIGSPAPVRRVESAKRKKKEKHPATLSRLLAERE
jgi:hypothetical protein